MYTHTHQTEARCIYSRSGDGAIWRFSAKRRRLHWMLMPMGGVTCPMVCQRGGSMWNRWKNRNGVCLRAHFNLERCSIMNESCPVCEWVMSHMWMSHVPYVNESCPMCEWGMPHAWMSHGPYVNEACPICEWVTTHICVSGRIEHVSDNLGWMSHVPHANESCPICEWAMASCKKGQSWHTFVWVVKWNMSSSSFVVEKMDQHANESWPICEWVMTHICVSRAWGCLASSF